MASKHVIDTHALIWYLEGNARLGERATSVLSDPESSLVIPVIVLAEAVSMVERGRTNISSVEDLVQDVTRDGRIELYPLTWDVFRQGLRAGVINEIHDRIIVATALHLQSLGHTVAIVTRDSVITQSNLVSVVW